MSLFVVKLLVCAPISGGFSPFHSILECEVLGITKKGRDLGVAKMFSHPALRANSVYTKPQRLSLSEFDVT